MIIYSEIIKLNPNKSMKFPTYDNREDIVEFDDDGDRLSAKYEILNYQSGKFVAVGTFRVLINRFYEQSFNIF